MGEKRARCNFIVFGEKNVHEGLERGKEVHKELLSLTRKVEVMYALKRGWV